MSKILEITKILYKNGGLSNLLFGSSKDKPLSTFRKVLNLILVSLLALLIMGVVFMFAYFLLILAKSSDGVYDYDYLQNILSIYIPLYCVFILVFLGNFMLSTLFLAEDNQIFMALPIKSHELYIAKFLNCLLYSYLFQLMLLVPCYLAFNLIFGHQLFIILTQILIFIVFPLIPFAVIMIVQSLLAKVINYGKHKSLFTFITFLLSISLLLVMELLSSTSINFKGTLTTELIIDFKAKMAETATHFKFFKYYLYFMLKGIGNNSFGSFFYTIIFALISISFTTLVITIIAPSYSRTLIDNSYTTSTSKKNISPEKVIEDGVNESKTLFGTYALKEWRNLTRSTSNVLQYILPPILITGVLAIIIFVTLFVSDSTKDAIMVLINNMKSLATFDSGFVVFYISAGSVLISTFNLSSSTAISREGRNAYFLKYTPVRSSTVIFAKIFWPFIINAVILTLVMFGVGFGFNLEWYIIILVWLSSLAINAFTQFLMISIDLKHPFTNWVNESDSSKQNMNSFLSIFCSIIAAAILIGLGIVLQFYWHLNIIIAFSALIIGTLLATLLIVLSLKKKGSRIFDHIQ